MRKITLLITFLLRVKYMFSVDCTSPNYYHDEATNAIAPNRCTSDCDCDGARKCSSASWCYGVSRTTSGNGTVNSTVSPSGLATQSFWQYKSESVIMTTYWNESFCTLTDGSLKSGETSFDCNRYRVIFFNETSKSPEVCLLSLTNNKYVMVLGLNTVSSTGDTCNDKRCRFSVESDFVNEVEVFFLKSMETASYMTAEDTKKVTANRSWKKEWERFTFAIDPLFNISLSSVDYRLNYSKTFYNIRSSSGYYLCINNDYVTTTKTQSECTNLYIISVHQDKPGYDLICISNVKGYYLGSDSINGNLPTVSIYCNDSKSSWFMQAVNKIYYFRSPQYANYLSMNTLGSVGLSSEKQRVTWSFEVTEQKAKNPEGLSSGSIIGIVLGSVFGALLLVLCFYCIRKKKKFAPNNEKKVNSNQPVEEINRLNQTGNAQLPTNNIKGTAWNLNDPKNPPELVKQSSGMNDVKLAMIEEDKRIKAQKKTLINSVLKKHCANWISIISRKREKGLEDFMSRNLYSNIYSSSLIGSYECRNCNMKFSHEDQLLNHKKKFCGNTSVASLNYQYPYLSEVRKSYPQERPQPTSFNEDIKERLRKNEEEFQLIKNRAFGYESDDKVDKAFKAFQITKQKLDINITKEEQDFFDLMRDLDSLNARESQFRSDAFIINKVLNDYNKRFLTSPELEKKTEMQSLLNSRIGLKEREDDYVWELKKLKETYMLTENLRLEGKKLNTDFKDERRQKILGLKILREKLEKERLDIMDRFDKLKNDDFTKGSNRIGVMVANTILNKDKSRKDFMNDVSYVGDMIRDEEKKIKNLKLEQANYLESAYIPQDLEVEEQRNGVRKTAEDLEYVINTNYKIRNIKDRAEKLSEIRKNLENFGVEKGLEKSQVRIKFRDEIENENMEANKEYLETVDEIERLKKEYVEAGGTDPEFLLNLNNLAAFYKENKLNITNQTMLKDPNMSAFMGTIGGGVNDQVSLFKGQSTIFNDNSNIFTMTGNNFSWNPFISDQENEKSQLIKDISTIKYGSDKVNNLIKKGNRTLADMKLKLAGMDPALSKAWEMKKKLFQTDLTDVPTEEEKLLNQLVTQEADAVRNMSKFPMGSALYFSKQDELKELITLRMELEKIVQEQKFSKMREQYDKNSSDEYYKNRKKEIADRLRGNYSKFPNTRKYSPLEGFVVHWDFSLCLPKKFDKGRITFGVFCKGETYYAPRTIEDHVCGPESFNTNKCIFAPDLDHVYDIPANKDAILVIELQMFFKDKDRSYKMEVYGWSMLELFDMKGDLLRGKFKIPFYSTKTNPNMLVDQLKNLRSVSNTMLYLRISFPQDIEYGYEDIGNPEKVADEYFIPFIHRKTIIRPENPLDLESEKRDVYGRWLPKRGDFMRWRYAPRIEESDSEEDDVGPIELDFMSGMQPEKVEEDYMQSPIRKGIYLRINNLKNFLDNAAIKIRVALVDETTVLKDEKENPCSFETEICEPPPPKKKIDPVERLYLMRHFNRDDKGSSAGDTSSGGEDDLDIRILEVDEDYIFFVDLQYYIKKYKAIDRLALVFQILIEDMDEDEGVDNFEKKMKDYNDERKFVGYSWFYFPLFSENRLRVGRHVEHIFNPPIKKPPINFEEVENMDVQMDFIIKEYVYDINSLDDAINKFLKDREAMKRKKLEKLKKRRKNRWEDLPLSDRPFIENLKIQYHDRPFEKGQGIDFYIDGARFLADNVTISKIVVYIINQSVDRMIPPQAQLADLSNGSYLPMYYFRQELRAPHFDPTLMALISVETIDNSNKESRIVGYGAINFFLNRATKKPPTSVIDSDIILMDGFYQIPLYCQEPIRKRPFSLDNMVRLDRMPCASLLVRINSAPMTEDGLRALGIDDVPQKDWEKKSIWIPAPKYGWGLYNTSFCNLRDTEKDLFWVRKDREEILQKDSAIKLLNYEGNTKEMTNAEILKWMNEKIQRNSSTEIIELMYFAKYVPSKGFKFSLDGFHNVLDPNHPHIGIFCLNPPAQFYQEYILDSSGIILNSNFNWDSPLASPQFNEGYFTFKDVRFEKNLTIIVDVKKIIFSERGNKSVIENIGWAVCPIFTANGYVRSGVYQLPLFKGTPLKKILEELPKTDPWPYIIEQTELKGPDKLQFLEPMSVMVRLLDSQREGHFQNYFDFTRVNYQYLPPSKRSTYGYNSAVKQRLETAKKMITLAPNKLKPSEFNDKITETAVDKLKIKVTLKET